MGRSRRCWSGGLAVDEGQRDQSRVTGVC